MPTKKPKPRAFAAKRAPEDIESLMNQFWIFVKNNPGLRIEQINGQLGTSTKDLALPVKKLILARRIKTKGEKRATTYQTCGRG